MLGKKSQPEFATALNQGKTFADAKVAESLFKRATGYSHPETKINCHDGEIIQTEVIKHYPPDPVSGIFWLRNRQPTLWKAKIEVKEESVIRIIPWDQLREISKEALEFAEAEHKRLIEGRAERLGITVDYETE
ncbi:hypothetical protein [Methylobacter sp.]|uniref:hypothetical protein n=1 Tax=Methylobacter sp. TaxID=2051955 RepID=UPI00248788E2|nr:hypothetical protein [Methylobacter sp.]MDI1277288.1 hypothetical protein [Methylobacter sp.]MDI1357854.1 hypothetical protein [Methylobacter sp.]